MPWDPLRDLRGWQKRLEPLSAHHADAVSAGLTNGVLTVTLPKAPQPPLRKIEVR